MPDKRESPFEARGRQGSARVARLALGLRSLPLCCFVLPCSVPRRQPLALLFFYRLNQTQEFAGQRGKFSAVHRTPRMNDDVPPCWYLREILPKNLANAPSDTIADHSAAQRFLHADAEAAVHEMIGPNENYELAARA